MIRNSRCELLLLTHFLQEFAPFTYDFGKTVIHCHDYLHVLFCSLTLYACVMVAIAGIRFDGDAFDNFYLHMCVAVYNEGIARIVQEKLPLGCFIILDIDFRSYVSSIVICSLFRCRECYWWFIYGVALSQCQQRLLCLSSFPSSLSSSISTSKGLPSWDLDHPLLQFMCSRSDLPEQIITWTSPSNYKTFIPYLSMLRSSCWYHQILTMAIYTLSCRRPDQSSILAEKGWSMSIPSTMCTCGICNEHCGVATFLRSNEQTHQIRSLQSIRSHIEKSLTEAFGRHSNTFSFTTIKKGASPHTLCITKEG
jgi:hypothetical protein